MKTKISLLIVLLSIMSYACQRMLDFPAFPDELAQNYFPYTNGTVLHFYNTENDTLEFTINNLCKSEAYSTPKNCDCQIDPYFSFNATNNICGFSLMVSINGKQWKNVQIGVTIGSSYISKVIKEANIFITKNYEIFGDKVFLENNSINVTIIKGKGITEWTDGDGEVWKLIE